MYLHLGASTVIHQSDVLGILDLDNTTASWRTRDFLARAEREGRVVSVGEDLPKAFLLCRDREGEVMVYLTQLSPATLAKRFLSDTFDPV